eukprot:6196415-Pleurochrysis_carterae.AAC.1
MENERGDSRATQLRARRAGVRRWAKGASMEKCLCVRVCACAIACAVASVRVRKRAYARARACAGVHAREHLHECVRVSARACVRVSARACVR